MATIPPLPEVMDLDLPGLDDSSSCHERQILDSLRKEINTHYTGMIDCWTKIYSTLCVYQTELISRESRLQNSEEFEGIRKITETEELIRCKNELSNLKQSLSAKDEELQKCKLELQFNEEIVSELRRELAAKDLIIEQITQSRADEIADRDLVSFFSDPVLWRFLLIGFFIVEIRGAGPCRGGVHRLHVCVR